MKTMKEHEIIKHMTSEFQAKIPDIEHVREKCLNQSADETAAKNIAQKKRQVFKPTKILATAAALLLVIGLFNIQTVIAFISGLFFVPGVGITDDDSIKYYGLERPITLTMDSGTATIEFVTKVTRNGRTELNMYIDSDHNFVSSSDLSHAVSISSNGEVIVSNGRLFENPESYNGKKVSYYYSNFAYDFPEIDDFPDISEFDLTICGVETHVSLIEQAGNAAISDSNNGITLSAYKFNGINAFLAMDVYDENADDSYKVIPSLGNWDLYNEKGEKFLSTYTVEGSVGTKYWLLEIPEKDREREVKRIKTQRIQMGYFPKNEIIIEIPVPKDGETIQTNIEIPIINHTFKITEIRREGDIIYYENNAGQVVTEKHDDGSIWFINTADFPNDVSGFEQAVTNCESFIHSILFTPTNWDMNGIKTEMMGGEIWNFDPDAETLTFYFTRADIIQYGNFDMIFD